MLEIRLDQLLKDGGLSRYSTEISELGWKGFPAHFSVPELADALSGSVFFLSTNLIDSQGEFYGAVYRQAMGPSVVTIYND